MTEYGALTFGSTQGSLPNEFYKAGVKFAFGTFNNQFSRNLPLGL